MRALLAALLLAIPCVAHADPPIELAPIVIHARGPTVFTQIARARVEPRADELRTSFVREVPRTVRSEPPF